MPTKRQYKERRQTRKISRQQKDSGINDKSPSAPNVAQTTFDGGSLRGPYTLEEEEEREERKHREKKKEEDRDQHYVSYRVFVEEGKPAGPQRIILENTTGKGRRCRFFIQEEKMRKDDNPDTEISDDEVDGSKIGCEMSTEKPRRKSTPRCERDNSTSPLIGDEHEPKHHKTKNRWNKRNAFIISIVGLVLLALIATTVILVVLFQDNKSSETNLEKAHNLTECSQSCPMSMSNGWTECKGDKFRFRCETDFKSRIPSDLWMSCDTTRSTQFCVPKDTNFMAASRLGQASSCGWKRTRGEELVLVMMGGEEDGQLEDTVEEFPYNRVPRCKLPPLPMKLKLGNAGFVGDSLLVCGGETELQNPNHACWYLQPCAAGWKSLTNLTR